MVSGAQLGAGGAWTSCRRAWGHGWSSSAWLCVAGEGSVVPHLPSRESLCSPLAGRPPPEARTKGSSQWADPPGKLQTTSCRWAHGLQCTGHCRGCPDFPWMHLGTGWSSNTQLCGPRGCSRALHPAPPAGRASAHHWQGGSSQHLEHQ